MPGIQKQIDSYQIERVDAAPQAAKLGVYRFVEFDMNKPNVNDAASPPEPAVAPDVPQTEEERRIVELIKAGLESGSPVPMDDAFFQRLLKRVPSDR